MKKLLLLSPLFGLFLSACSNDFKINAPFKDIPVVYGIISPQDTAHYIRVERAFIDPDVDARVVAQIPDSIYYPVNAIAVSLERVNTGQRYPMTRVDGNLEGYVRDNGTFAQSPNWLYKVKPAQLGSIVKGGEQYRLIIERADGNPTITAETTVPDTTFLVSPQPLDIPRQIAITTTGQTNINWRTSPSGSVFDVYMNIRYRELDANGTFLTNKSIRWRVSKNIIRENTPLAGGLFQAKTSFSANAFYNALFENVDTMANVQRFFNGIDIEIIGAGPEISDYQEIQAINSGLTGAEVSARYSNLSEGFGIFTARKSWIFPDFALKPVSIQDLNADNRRRVLLKFKG